MADFSTLIASLEQYITENGEGAITGQILQDELLLMVNTINQLKQDTLESYGFAGGALADGDSATATQNTFWLVTAGTYTINGTAYTIADTGISVLVYDSEDDAVTSELLLAFDTTPTEGSTNPVTSDALYNEQYAREDAVNGLHDTIDEEVTNRVNADNALQDNIDDETDARIAADALLQDKDTDATEGNLAVFDDSGNSVDSGVALGDVALVNGTYPSMVAGAAEGVLGASSTDEFVFEGIAKKGAVKVDEIRGASYGWNQLAQGISTQTANGVTLTSNSDGTFTLNGTALGGANFAQTVNIVSGHKYLLKLVLISGTATINNNTAQVYGDSIINMSLYATSGAVIGTATGTGSAVLRYHITSGDAFTDAVFAINLFDLTLMGLDDITSVDEFTALFPLPYYSYNAGSLLSFNGTALVATGVNQWDEEWELGTFDASGNPVSSSSTIRSKNFIPILPNTAYYHKAASTWVEMVYYDKNYDFIVKYGTDAGALHTTPTNAHYAKFRTSSSYGTTYSHDICINISNSAVNGNYYPYRKQTTDLSWIYDLKDGDGNTLFPNGVCGAGSAYDKVTPTRATKRIGRVNLGDLSWVWNAAGFFTANLTGLKYQTNANLKANIISSGYITSTANRVFAGTDDKAISSASGSAQLWIKDTAFNGETPEGLAAFQSAMAGVKLNYELATPVSVDYDYKPMNTMAEYGTIALSPENGSTPTTAPCSVKWVLPSDAVSVTTIETILTALKTAGVISAYTLTKGTDGEYSCTITA